MLRSTDLKIPAVLGMNQIDSGSEAELSIAVSLADNPGNANKFDVNQPKKAEKKRQKVASEYPPVDAAWCAEHGRNISPAFARNAAATTTGGARKSWIAIIKGCKF